MAEGAKLQLWRVAFDVRFAHRPRLLGAAGELIDHLVLGEEGWHWRASQPQSQVMVETPDRSMRFLASIERANAFAEYPFDRRLFEERLARWIKRVLGVGHVRNTTRLGTQFTYLLPVDSFDATVTRLAELWYPARDDWWKPFGGPPIDVGVPLTLTLGSERGSFVAGPMRRDEARGRFATKAAQDAITGDVVYIDLDVFAPVPRELGKEPEATCQRFYDSAADRIEKIVPAFAEGVPTGA